MSDRRDTVRRQLLAAAFRAILLLDGEPEPAEELTVSVSVGRNRIEFRCQAREAAAAPPAERPEDRLDEA